MMFSGAPLSPRQRQIARLVASGLPTKAIGAELRISPWTVASHLRRIYARLGVRSRAAMVARLFEAQLQGDTETTQAAERSRSA